jgi:hypothetical protein
MGKILVRIRETVRLGLARWLAPELVEAEDRYHRLISRMQDDYWWLGEFPDASEAIRYLLDSHRNRYRAIGEPRVGNLPDDISDFREHLRRRALENQKRGLADANSKDRP